MKTIAIEGIDGAGKGLQFNLLSQKLVSLGKRCVTLSLPQYDGFFGHEIGKMLSGAHTASADVVDAKSMALWYAMDRWQAFNMLDLTDADYLIFDRYVLSNVVYQSLRAIGGREDTAQGLMAQEAFAQWVFELEHTQLRLPRPDIYILLDVNRSLAQQNVLQKGNRDYIGNIPDVYERSAALLENVHRTYLHFAGMLDNVSVIPSTDETDGKMLPPGLVASHIWRALQERNLV